MLVGAKRSLLKAPAVASTPFDPVSLFLSGEDGFLFDFSDTSTLWQDGGRTVQADANANPVLRIDDLSGNSVILQSASALTLNISGGVNFITNSAGTINTTFNSGTPASGNYSIFVATRWLDDTVTGYRGIVSTPSSTTANGALFFRGATDRFGTFGSSTWYPSNTEIIQDTDYVLGINQTGSVFRVEGANSGTWGATQGQLSPLFGQASQISNCRIYGALAINRGLTSTEQANVESWLRDLQGRSSF